MGERGREGEMGWREERERDEEDRDILEIAPREVLSIPEGFEIRS